MKTAWLRALRRVLLGKTAPTAKRKPRRPRSLLQLEWLEDRIHPAVSVGLSGYTLSVEGSASDSIYLSSQSGQLAWSSTGTTGSFSTDLDSSTSGTQGLSL